MSAVDEQGTPTPATLEDAFLALDAQDGPANAPDPAAPRPEETRPQATDAAPQTPGPAPAAEQQPGETDIDYKARAAELEQQIQNREWSSQGRYLQEKAKREALEARIKELEDGSETTAAERWALYDTAIAKAQADGDPDEARRLSRELAIEKRELALALKEGRAQATEKVTAAEAQAAEQAAYAQHEHVLRTGTVSELVAEARRVAAACDLPEDLAEQLVATVDTPANKILAANAPPKVLAAAIFEQITALAARGQQLQQRLVARNREAASDAGTYRGPVDTASAPIQQPFKRDPSRRDVDQLADYFAQSAQPG